MEGTTINSSKLRFIENKTKIRLGNNAEDLSSSYKLVTAANNHGLILTGLRDGTIRGIPFSSFNQLNDGSSEYPIVFKTVAPPQLLTVARFGYSSILLVTSNQNNCPHVEAFDLDKKELIGQLQLTEVSGSNIVDYAWHPNFYDSLVALCTNTGNLLVVAISRRDRAISLIYNKHHGTLSCCWSPKGKNLAIGTTNGQVLRLEPVISTTSFSFKGVDNSTIVFSHPKMTPEHQIIKLRWINKTYLMGVHARPRSSYGPDSIYTLFTIKPSKPYRYWTNLCFENQISQNYIVNLTNFTNTVICTSNASGEAGVIGVEGSKEAASSDIQVWHSIIVDEGARIELPLDSSNRETYPLGSTVFDQTNLVFYTSDGVICSFTALHDENILKLPEFQPEEKLPLIMKRTTENFTPNVKFSENLTKYIEGLTKDIQDLTKEIEGIKSLMLFEGVNHMRSEFDDTIDSHHSIRDALSYFQESIQSLELATLENFSMIEYLKIQERKGTRARTIDPVVMKKVEALRRKSMAMADRLKELKLNVDVAWEDSVRKDRRQSRGMSLDMIYKNLATNQNIINHLKKKIPRNVVKKSPVIDNPTESVKISCKELNQSKLTSFRKFLASRDFVPVRRPDMA